MVPSIWCAVAGEGITEYKETLERSRRRACARRARSAGSRRNNGFPLPVSSLGSLQDRLCSGAFKFITCKSNPLR